MLKKKKSFDIAIDGVIFIISIICLATKGSLPNMIIN